MAFDIPIEIEGIRRDQREQMFSQGRFAHLPWPGHKSHLTLFRKESIDLRREIAHDLLFVCL